MSHDEPGKLEEAAHIGKELLGRGRVMRAQGQTLTPTQGPFARE